MAVNRKRMPPPDPRAWPRHRQVADDFAGAPIAFTSGQVLTALVAIAGTVKGRFYVKASTTGGTLSFRFIRPTVNRQEDDPSDRDAYTTLPATALTVVAGTEGKQDLTFEGEEILEVTFTAGSGSGTLDYLDFCAI